LVKIFEEIKMPRKKVSFLAKRIVKRRVSFESGGEEVSFIAKVPAKRRKRVTFYVRKKK
jgi:hypothetical protein